MAISTGRCSSDLQQWNNARTIFTHHLNPPLSPPPSSPLPLPPISPSSNSSSRSNAPSPRPPRQQTSLPDLRPGVSKSFNRQQTGSHMIALSSDSHTKLQSPFTSPNASSDRVARRVYSPVVPSIRGKGYSAESLHADLFMNSGNGRIWWSSIPESPTAGSHIPSDWPLVVSVPQIPPRSNKRRTQRSPHTAIARSALHIPPRTVSVASQSIETLSMSSISRSNTPLLQDEPITSLPPWPSGDDMKYTTNSRSVRTAPARTEEPGPPCSKLAHVGVSNYGRNVLPDPKSEAHISFCAVTNLEDEAFTHKEVTSTSGDGMEVEITPDVVPLTWYRRHRKHIWVIVTILVVLMSAGGILTGIIWRLSQIHRFKRM